MKKRIVYTVLILSLLLSAACKSTPQKEEPDIQPSVETQPVEVVEEAVVEKQPEEEPVKEKIEPVPMVVKESEFAAARQALERAETVEASRFASHIMGPAYKNLKKAKALASKDPVKSRSLLASVKKGAREAYKVALAALIREWELRLAELDKDLVRMKAPQYSPDFYAKVKAQFENTIRAIRGQEVKKARRDFHKSKLMAKNLQNSLDENLRWIGILERDTKNYLDEAEKEESYAWASKEFNRASYLLTEGMLQFRNYNLEAAEAALKEARFRAKDTLYLTQVRKKQAETDALVEQVQMALEEASTLQVEEEDGSIKDAAPWSGNDYLKDNPLIQAEAGEYKPEKSKLLDYNLETGTKEGRILEEEEEEIQRRVSSLLEKAKLLWEEAVRERNAGNYDKSRELLSQAEAYIKVYESRAVGKRYTVVYRKERQDCLWRIAEFKEIYDDPYLWPRIWQRNQKSIPNPDLIYPGQVLVIPPVR